MHDHPLESAEDGGVKRGLPSGAINIGTMSFQDVTNGLFTDGDT